MLTEPRSLVIQVVEVVNVQGRAPARDLLRLAGTLEILKSVVSHRDGEMPRTVLEV